MTTQTRDATIKQPIAKDSASRRNGSQPTGGPKSIHLTAGADGGEPASGTNAQPDLGSPSYLLLTIACETLDDVEQLRIASENRARALVHPEQNIRLAEDDPAVVGAKRFAAGLLAVEKDARKEVDRLLRATPVWPWVRDTAGLGPAIGRLLGVVGNPRERMIGETGEVLPRSPSQLRSYCGFGDAAVQRRRKGEQGNWNPRARTAAWNVANALMKQRGSPYRATYDAARAKYDDAVHDRECMNRSRFNPNGCGTREHPEWGAVDSPLRDGHKHARAIRAVAKEMLLDLWKAAE